MKTTEDSGLLLEAINMLILFGGSEFHKWGEGLVVYSRKWEEHNYCGYYWHLVVWDATRWRGEGNFINLEMYSKQLLIQEQVVPLGEDADQDFTGLRSHLETLLRVHQEGVVLFEKPQRIVIDSLQARAI